jgi:predicted kinase
MGQNRATVSEPHSQRLDQLPVLVVVTGPPASGKSTIADALRARLGFPLIAKDSLKEVLGEALHVEGRADSQRLGGAIFFVLAHVVHELLAHGVSVIAEGNFHAESALFTGLPPARIVQVHVSAQLDELRRRMVVRAGERHAVHYDADAATEVATRAAAGEWAALPLHGDLVEVDTTEWPDLAELTDGVAAITRSSSNP